MKSYNLSKKIVTYKYNIYDYIKQNKYRFIICFAFVLVGLLTGIFTAIDIVKLDKTKIIEAFDIIYKIEDFSATSSDFFGRLFSHIIILLFLFVLSCNVFTCFVGYFLIAYRAFLLALNCYFLIYLFSFIGLFNTLIIIIPCQIVMLFIMILYFCYSCKHFKVNKCLKQKKFNKCLSPLFIALLALSVVNIIETLLLTLLKANVILVI